MTQQPEHEQRPPEGYTDEDIERRHGTDDVDDDRSRFERDHDRLIREVVEAPLEAVEELTKTFEKEEPSGGSTRRPGERNG